MSGLTPLTPDDLNALQTGAWILGAGGGGDPYFGYLAIKKLYREGKRISLLDPSDLSDDAWVAAVNQMGSPLPAEERLTDPATIAKAVRRMEQYQDIRFDAVMPWEIGGGNAFQPLLAAAMLDLPVVDADAMGRAFPEAQMTSFAVMGLHALSARHGRHPREHPDHCRGRGLEVARAAAAARLRRARRDRRDLQPAADRP